MVTGTAQSWTEHSISVLADAGYRSSAAREEVISAIAELRCSVTAREISDLLCERGSPVGLASIYRALDVLDQLHLVQRFDVGEGTARFEPALPSGDHHHHLVCDTCGAVEQFEDDVLERAIEAVEQKTEFSITNHEVTLHGECPACRTAA